MFININRLFQPDNPTDEERYAQARQALAEKGRLDDFEYIREVTSTPPDITTIARPGGLRGNTVGIIGGGLAGLSAAFELRKLGFDITVFDALLDRIGGRIYTYYFDQEKRFYGELGAMRIPVTHETSWHYINLFQLDTSPFIQSNENAFIYLRNARVRNDPGGYNVQRYIYPRYDLTPWERSIPWQKLEFYGYESSLLRSNPQIRSEIMRVLYKDYPQVSYWDTISIRKLLESESLSQDAISLLSNFLPLSGENLYNNYIDYIQELYSVDLNYAYQINGGTVNLPLAFYKALLDKKPLTGYQEIPHECLGPVTWRGGHWITGIYQDGNDQKPVLSFRSVNSENTSYLKFDYVICAIPFSTLRTIDINPLFSKPKIRAIKELNYIASQKTALYCTKKFWEEGGPNERILGGVSFTDLPATMIWYPSYKSDEKIANVPGVLLVYNYNLDTVRLTNMDEKERFIEMKQEIEDVHGLQRGYLNNIITDYKVMNWDNEPWFRGALCMYTPEQKRLFSFAAVSPEYNGRVFFAGEHTSGKHRWIQGALKSGMQAANDLSAVCISRKGKG